MAAGAVADKTALVATAGLFVRPVTEALSKPGCTIAGFGADGAVAGGGWGTPNGNEEAANDDGGGGGSVPDVADTVDAMADGINAPIVLLFVGVAFGEVLLLPMGDVSRDCAADAETADCDDMPATVDMGDDDDDVGGRCVFADVTTGDPKPLGSDDDVC